MSYYKSNPACHCSRCSTRGLMGPAVLITLGALFLMDNSGGYGFERTWPILLIVIGAVKVIRYLLPHDDHVNPGPVPPPYGWQPWQAGQPPYNQPGQPYGQPFVPPPGPAAVTPPPAAAASTPNTAASSAPSAEATTPDASSSDEVHHG